MAATTPASGKFKLSTFQSALASGGARPSLFKMTISGQPTGVSSADVANIEYFCNVSAFPPLTITPIERQYFGRTTKIPGDMTFGDLSTSIIQTEGGAERIAMEKWMDVINKTSDNKMNAASVSANGFTGTVKLHQYGKSGSATALHTVTFVDCWPNSIAEISMSYDTASDIEVFDVTWSYNYYTFA